MGWAERRKTKREEILQTARKLFIGKGFHETSLDDIIAVTGGSRRAIYDLFSSKEGLFEAALGEMLDGIVAGFSELPPTDAEPAEWLEAFGRQFLTAMIDEDAVSTMRQFISVAAERPEAGRMLYERGPMSLYKKLAGYFDEQNRRGTLHVSDPMATARIFADMIKGDMQLWAMLAGGAPPTDEAINHQVSTAVDILLNGIKSR